MRLIAGLLEFFALWLLKLLVLLFSLSLLGDAFEEFFAEFLDYTFEDFLVLFTRINGLGTFREEETLLVYWRSLLDCFYIIFKGASILSDFSADFSV